MHLDRRHFLVLAALAAAVPPARARTATAPALPLAGVWSDALDPAPYLVSEKYDGVRGVWDGATLRFRSGRAVPAPAWFSARLPRGVPLDGELWLGRGRFDALSTIVRTKAPDDADWRALRYLVFERPGGAASFAERAREIEAIVRHAAWPQLVAVEHTPVADRAALQRRLDATVAQGGEGLVLHLAAAPYRTGRSDTLLKLKPALDAEATVVGYHAGRGKHAGRLGALVVRAPDGRQFRLGSGLSDALRDVPPAPGKVVTYRYRELTPTGLPRFASFWRIHDAL